MKRGSRNNQYLTYSTATYSTYHIHFQTPLLNTNSYSTFSAPSKALKLAELTLVASSQIPLFLLAAIFSITLTSDYISVLPVKIQQI